MKTIKLNENRINHSDLWIIGGTSVLGLGTGLLMHEKMNDTILGFLVIGIGLGLVLSSLITRNIKLNRIELLKSFKTKSCKQ